MHCKHCGYVMLLRTPATPGPRGWAARCPACGWIRDISAEAEAEVTKCYPDWEIKRYHRYRRKHA